MRVLIVEDEEEMARLVRQALEEEAYAVDVVGNGREALEWLAGAAYDLVVLDVMLPGKDGVQVCREYRASGGRAAILMLTARDAMRDRVLGLDSGADDYLIKPFGTPELLARLRALARRDGPSKTPELRVQDLALNTVTKRLTRAGQPIKLTALEYALLEFLMRHARQVVARDQIIEHVWNADFESEQRFTSDASHELRTPLGLLKAQITLALARPRDAPALMNMVQAMEGYVDRMTRLIETMLSLARTGEPLNQHVWVDLAELLGGLAGQMQDASASRRIRFTLDTSSALNANVMGDPDRLTQLFMNLLDNAVKYSPEGSSVHISLKPQASGWAIDVADEGVGIAPKHLAHVFERFYRADASRARQTGGIGLGLPIAQAIAKQHGGRITVQSNVGSGSMFTVWLPKISSYEPR